MKECRWILSALGIFAAAVAAAQSPFAPPAQLGSPVPASPAEQIFVPPPPGPIAPPRSPAPPLTAEGPIFGLQFGLVRPSLGGYIATGPLNLTVTPNFMAGWQFPSGRAILFEYEYFGANADRTTQFPNDPGPVVTHRHVEGHIFDFDVRFLEGGWALLKSQTEVGIRAANISYYANRPSQNYPSLVSNRFEGFGPHLNYKIAVTLFDTGFELFARTDIGLLFGKNTGFSQVQDPPYSGTFVDWSHSGSVRTTATGRLELGAAYWFRVGYSRAQLSGGYIFDGYYFPSAGERIGSGGGPLGIFPFKYEPGYVSLYNKGPFVRMEFKY